MSLKSALAWSDIGQYWFDNYTLIELGFIISLNTENWEPNWETHVPEPSKVSFKGLKYFRVVKCYNFINYGLDIYPIVSKARLTKK